MAKPNFFVRRATWQRNRDSLRRVREQVFVQEQQVPLALEWDGCDEDALHLLAESAERRPVGTARMLPDGHVGRMAVLPEWRRRGVGSALLRELMRIANEQGSTRPFLNAQTHALGFFRRHGFIADGPEFMEAGIPHRRLVLSP